MVLGLLGHFEVDVGLPALDAMWPFLVIVGAGFMAPMIVWAIRMALEKQIHGA